MQGALKKYRRKYFFPEKFFPVNIFYGAISVNQKYFKIHVLDVISAKKNSLTHMTF